MGRRIVFGDVHGHYRAVCALLDKISPSHSDTLYFLGDLIDRGPEVARVVEFVKENNHYCILGNHEIMLLDSLGGKTINPIAFQTWLRNGGNATVASYGQKVPPPEHIEWFKTLPLYMDLGDFWLVHAGVHPNLPISKQSQAQFCWIRQEFHCIEKPYFPDKTIIVGHTITFTFNGLKPGDIAQGEGWLGIDTGVYHVPLGRLTALDLDNSLVYQVDGNGHNFRCLPLSEVTHKINRRHLFSRSLTKLLL
ncbi:MAG: metallophosphoesterase family protein [Geminocystis sp.]|nr:serine/threonine protein phosphatase [Geminocystis sp.]MDW8116833.1 metallophosphoesterase family protein [Geminocystis sp.]MDW8463968.1 metallophosphoesterase family protein [Geminocystis sp.]